MGSVRADIIEIRGGLSDLLTQIALEDVVREMNTLHAAAVRGRMAPGTWLPVALASDDDARYGLCLNNPSHAMGAGEADSLAGATAAAAGLTPTDPRLEYRLVRDVAGQPHALQPTLRLRIEHWRSLARRIWDSLPQALAAAAQPAGHEPAPLLLGRIWPGSGPNVVADFATAQDTEDLLSFTDAVVRGSEPLHLRISFCCHVLALRRFRLENPAARADLESLLARLESEIYGDYHLDGQSAYRALRSVGWDDDLEILEI